MDKASGAFGAHDNRGIAYCLKGQHDQAISDFNKAIEIDPKHAGAFYSRGIAYAHKGQYDQAISDFNKAIEINPKHAGACYSRGLAYNHKGQFDQAIADWQKARELEDCNGGIIDKVFDMVDEMLKNPNKLTRNELDWVSKIDQTVGGFTYTGFTPRQSEVIIDIYEKFKKR